MDKVTLLPCPSCGWKDPSYQHIRDGCSLECRNRDCGLSVRAFNPNSHDKCGVNWNTRATPAPDSEKLREALKPFAEVAHGEVYERFKTDSRSNFRISNGDGSRHLTFINAECFDAARAALGASA